MAFSDYTSSIYGSKNLYPFSVNYASGGGERWTIERINKEHIKETSDGRTRGGDVFSVISYQIFSGLTTACDTSIEDIQETIENINDEPVAILAIERRTGNSNYSGTASGRSMVPFLKMMNADPAITSYDMYIVFSNKGKQGISLKANQYFASGEGVTKPGYTNQLSVGTRRRYRRADNYPPYEITETAKLAYGVITRDTPALPNHNVITKMKNLIDYITNTIQRGYNGSYYDTSIINAYEPKLLDSLSASIAVWSAEENTVIDDISVMFLHGRATQIGNLFNSSIPIFSSANFIELVNYFQGREYEQENPQQISDVDWSTDWTVYVRGATKPDIFVTMESRKVDEWLESSANKSGIKKSDIKVEWRNRVLNAPKMGEYILKDWKETSYDKQLDSSYMELMLLTWSQWSELNNEVGGSGIENMDLISLYDHYAEWEFRIVYGKSFSNWCYARIGVIGSPSVPDFSQMVNAGGQTDYSISDNSTVTIVYDEYPPGYDPYDPPPKPSDPGIIGGDTLPGTPTGPNGLGLLTATYMLTEAQCRELGDFFWNQDIFDKIKALNTSPLENVVSIKMIPYSVVGQPAQLIIGNVNTNINADRITVAPLYSVGDIEYQGRYGSFLDHHPYTTAQIFLPYIGFVPIDPYIFTNKRLHVDYAFDLITGQCKAMLSVDRIYFANYTGQCGIDIPLVNGTRAALEASLITTIGGLALSPLSSGASASAVLGGVSSLVGSEFHTQRTGGVSPSTNLYETRMCYIVIDSADGNYSRSFAHDYGFPCLATYSLSQLSGFTKCEENVDVSGISGATNAEKEEIKSILTHGVYL